MSNQKLTRLLKYNDVHNLSPLELFLQPRPTNTADQFLLMHQRYANFTVSILKAAHFLMRKCLLKQIRTHEWMIAQKSNATPECFKLGIAESFLPCYDTFLLYDTSRFAAVRLVPLK